MNEATAARRAVSAHHASAYAYRFATACAALSGVSKRTPTSRRRASPDCASGRISSVFGFQKRTVGRLATKDWAYVVDRWSHTITRERRMLSSKGVAQSSIETSTADSAHRDAMSHPLSSVCKRTRSGARLPALSAFAKRSCQSMYGSNRARAAELYRGAVVETSSTPSG
jgi:hypothetical protein